jgi:lysophospholipase L1-like esterase
MRGILAAAVVAGCAASDRAPPTASHALEQDAPLYIAVGDSFTIGTGSNPTDAFPARLAARWQRAGCVVRLSNLAVNGFTTDDLLAEELPHVRGPAFVTLAIGANDIVAGSDRGAYAAQLARIFDALASAGVVPARIVALPQPDWSQSPAAASLGDRTRLAASIRAFNAALRDETRARGARYVDLFPTMERQAARRMIASDGLHPNAAAYDEWAEELFRAIPPVCPGVPACRGLCGPG